jgi:hypothetical protein
MLIEVVAKWPDGAPPTFDNLSIRFEGVPESAWDVTIVEAHPATPDVTLFKLRPADPKAMHWAGGYPLVILYSEGNNGLISMKGWITELIYE